MSMQQKVSTKQIKPGVTLTAAELRSLLQSSISLKRSNNQQDGLSLKKPNVFKEVSTPTFNKNYQAPMKTKCLQPSLAPLEQSLLHPSFLLNHAMVSNMSGLSPLSDASNVQTGLNVNCKTMQNLSRKTVNTDKPATSMPSYYDSASKSQVSDEILSSLNIQYESGTSTESEGLRWNDFIDTVHEGGTEAILDESNQSNEPPLGSANEHSNLIEIEQTLHNESVCCAGCRHLLLTLLKKQEEIILNQGINRQASSKNFMLIPEAPAFTLLHMLPIEDKEVLKDFDTKLRDAQNVKMKQEFKMKISGIGGNDMSKEVSNILSSIVTDALAHQLTWKVNKENKLRIDNFHFPQIINEIIRTKYNLTKEAVSDRIKIWLQKSSDRLRYAATREKKKQSQI